MIPVEFSVRIVVQLAELEPFDVASDLTEKQLFIACKNNTISLHRNVNCTADHSVMANDVLQHASE